MLVNETTIKPEVEKTALAEKLAAAIQAVLSKIIQREKEQLIKQGVEVNL